VTLKLPLYFSINDRPIKAISTPDGGVDVLKLDLHTGEFVRDKEQLAVYLSGKADVENLTPANFEALVRWHLDNIGHKK
jgi:hypothetical protein